MIMAGPGLAMRPPGIPLGVGSGLIDVGVKHGDDDLRSVGIIRLCLRTRR